MCTQNTEKCLAQNQKSEWWVIASTEKYVENNQDMIENGQNEEKTKLDISSTIWPQYASDHFVSFAIGNWVDIFQRLTLT